LDLEFANYMEKQFQFCRGSKNQNSTKLKKTKDSPKIKQNCKQHCSNWLRKFHS